MGIRIIQGPHTEPPSQGMLTQMQHLARAAGQTLELCRCHCLSELVEEVRASRSSATQFMLLDPGELAEEARRHPEAGLEGALDTLDTPYVEVHEQTEAELDHPAWLRHPPVATVIISGDLGSSYRIGLGIALRQLGLQRAA